MGSYCEGEGWAEKVDLEKAKEYIIRHRDKVRLKFVVDQRLLEFDFPDGRWSPYDDFDAPGRGTGVFRDLREALTTAPAVLYFRDEVSEPHLVLLTPPRTKEPYIDVGLIHTPDWMQIPAHYQRTVRRYFGRESL